MGRSLRGLAVSLATGLLPACADVTNDGARAPTPAQTTPDDVEAPDAGPPVDPNAGRACPDDMSLSVGPRSIDVSPPWTAIPGVYSKDGTDVKPSELLDKEAAIRRVLSLEAATPGLVPAGFREDVKTKGRDPWLRIFMARCELRSPSTLRRAGYDAGLAYLLGARDEDVEALTRESFYPDGVESSSCIKDAQCVAPKRCDTRARSCRSDKDKAASLVSNAELDVEDTLARAFVALLTPEDLRYTGYRAHFYVGDWAFGRIHRCGAALCEFRRGSVGRPVRHLDLRVGRDPGRPDMTPARLSPAEKRCKEATDFVSFDQCKGYCESGSHSAEAACMAKCAAFCR